jgi:nucleoside-diphosphate-sugar epimerase
MSGLKRIMVTGASGLLGRAIIEKIYNSYEIYAVISGHHPVNFFESVHTVKADLLDERTREHIMADIQPEILLHYAWNVQDTDFESSENNIIWLEASLHLLRSFVANAGKRILFAGAGAEYGTRNEKKIEKDAPPFPPCGQLSLYGAAKLSFSAIMENYCSAHGMEYVDARYFSVYGENDNRLYAVIPQTILRLLNNESVICKYPDNVWDYIYIQDAVDISVKLIESTYCGSVNICSGIPQKMGDVFKMMAKELEKEFLLSFEYKNGCNRVCIGDTSIMEQQLGSRCNVPFDVGIKKTIVYFKNIFESKSMEQIPNENI